ncbi:acyl-CoA carboxylase epsilon subunit [Streptomyces massasporeus]|uniref:acyl-CoA carboxylase epsilon subunit n=1 Tax=Streptomyces massasporeus TaxID=67324 RepID=UPI0038242E24
MSGKPAAPALGGPLAPALFRVVNGSPTPEELAAVAALVAAIMADADRSGPAPGPRTPTRWHRPEAPPPASWQARA